jgi:uncharacterized delta-60 repeat protein
MTHRVPVRRTVSRPVAEFIEICRGRASRRLVRFETLEPRILCRAGLLDPTFGAGGEVRANLGGFDAAIDLATDVTIDGRGRIVVVGRTQLVREQDTVAIVSRWLDDGRLDTSFGDGDGIATLGPDDFLHAVQISSDGHIVVAGYRWKPGDGDANDFSVYRFDERGALDRSFGIDGISTATLGRSEVFNNLDIQPDGRIVAVGATSGRAWADDSHFAVARFNPDGSLDTTFAGDGIVTHQIGTTTDSAHGVVVQPDGCIVVAGAALEITESFNSKVALMRFNPDGSFDAGFGSAGIVHDALPGDNKLSRFFSVTLDSKARILAGGEAAGAVVVRYHPDGLLDTTFGADGVARHTSGNDASDIEVDANGRILAAAGYAGKFGVLRFNADGSVDTTFGSEGVAWAHPVSNPEFEARASRIVLQRDGNIVAVGEESFGTDALIARFQGNAGPAADPVIPSTPPTNERPDVEPSVRSQPHAPPARAIVSFPKHQRLWSDELLDDDRDEQDVLATTPLR